MSPETTIAWYVTPHGYGHLARSCDILLAWLDLCPTARVVLSGTAFSSFVFSRLPQTRVTLRRAAFDVGLVQFDSIRADPAASLHAALELTERRSALVREEAAFLRSIGARIVVADIPSLPLEAAAAVGLPSAAVGNFSWNWIYETMAQGDERWNPVAAMYREGYARADLLLRLPFHEPMNAFRRRLDVPVVALPGRRRREEIARAAGCDPAARWVLVGMGTVGWSDSALDRLEALRDVVFLTVRPLEWRRRNFRAFDPTSFPFADLVASADVVLSKPGYGILSECVVNDRPLVCVERDDFPEARVLVPAIRRYLRHAFVAQTDFYAGAIESALKELREAPPPSARAPAGGAPIAARALMRLANEA